MVKRERLVSTNFVIKKCVNITRFFTNFHVLSNIFKQLQLLLGLCIKFFDLRNLSITELFYYTVEIFFTHAFVNFVYV